LNRAFVGVHILNSSKSISFILVTVFVLLLLPAIQVGVFGAEEYDVRFLWAFGAMVGPEDKRELKPIKQDTELKSGDQMKFLVGIEKKCFVYLFFTDEKEKISLLFPNTFSQFDCPFFPKIYYIPAGEMWFELDQNTGQETFYLLASSKRLSSIENLYDDYSTASSKQKKEIAPLFFKKIREKRKEHMIFEMSAERAPNIGGRVRGLTESPQSGPSIESIATEICTTDFYCKTYTIDHKEKK